MLIALYQDHHDLPFWGGKTNPFDVFDPEKHKDLPFEGEEIKEEKNGYTVIVGYKARRFEEVAIFSFLSGLQDVKADHLMAHVSAICGCTLKEKCWWHYPKRVWVQISEITNEFTKDGLPVVYNIIGERKPEIAYVWGGDNGTRWPYQFFESEEVVKRATSDPRVWTRFFVEQLDLDTKLKMAKEQFHAEEELLTIRRRYVDDLQIFGKDKLNQKINEQFNAC